MPAQREYLFVLVVKVVYEITDFLAPTQSPAGAFQALDVRQLQITLFFIDTFQQIVRLVKLVIVIKLVQAQILVAAFQTVGIFGYPVQVVLVLAMVVPLGCDELVLFLGVAPVEPLLFLLEIKKHAVHGKVLDIGGVRTVPPGVYSHSLEHTDQVPVVVLVPLEKGRGYQKNFAGLVYDRVLVLGVQHLMPEHTDQVLFGSHVAVEKHPALGFVIHGD